MSKKPTVISAHALLPNPHPGEILLQEFLRPMGLSQNAMARALNVPPRRINEIVLGKRAVTADTDLRLDRYLGLSEAALRRVEIGEQVEGVGQFRVVWSGALFQQFDGAFEQRRAGGIIALLDERGRLPLQCRGLRRRAGIGPRRAHTRRECGSGQDDDGDNRPDPADRHLNRDVE